MAGLGKSKNKERKRKKKKLICILTCNLQKRVTAAMNGESGSKDLPEPPHLNP
jgi:hypothetical protein